MSKHETVIGLEIHIQLATASKMFCRCSNQPTGMNLELCPVCLGLPGALPVPNLQALRLTQELGAAISATLPSESRFDRKHYYYPDLPKGYQISQYQHPLVEGGEISFKHDGQARRVRIERIHLEEDAGKNLHRGSETLVDLGRAGTPLVEMVTEPDLRSPAEAVAFLRRLQILIRNLEVGEANMEKGELRVDANISIHPPGTPLGTKVELKNMNSFRFIEQALEYEVDRQTAVLGSGENVTQETRGFIERTGETVSQRTKEQAQDYRYLPDPDLPPLEFSKSDLDEIHVQTRAKLQKLAGDAEDEAAYWRKLEEAGLKMAQDSPFRHPVISDRLIGALKVHLPIAVNLDSVLPIEMAEEIRLDRDFATLNGVEAIVAVAEGKVSSTAAKQALTQAMKESKPYADVMRESSSLDLGAIVEAAIAALPQAVTDYKAGNHRALDVLVGYSMKRSEGRADPAALRRLLEEKLS